MSSSHFETEGKEPALLAQFYPLEEALAAFGFVVWPVVELEADDALASAAVLSRYGHIAVIPLDDLHEPEGRPSGAISARLAQSLRSGWEHALLFLKLAGSRRESGPSCSWNEPRRQLRACVELPRHRARWEGERRKGSKHRSREPVGSNPWHCTFIVRFRRFA